MRTVITFAVLAALASCAFPTPIPTPIPAEPDAPTADVFDDYMADCSTVPSDYPSTSVVACLDTDDTSACLSGLYPASSRDAIACTIRTFSMRSHVALAEGGPDAKLQSETSRADAWVRSHRLGYRGATP